MEDFTVNVYLAVPARIPGHYLPVKVDGQNVIYGDLAKTQALRLHEEQPVAARIAH
jgi:hypothetical protein